MKIKGLKINLSEGSIKEEELGEEILQRYIGGRGLGAYLYLREAEKENPVIITLGPLTGSPFPSTGRANLTTRSPLTGTILDSNIGGNFGALLRKAGYDFLLIKGKSLFPTYIFISEGEAKIENASKLWGLDTMRTSERLKEIHGKKLSVIAIGRAGENGVRFANIMEDGRRAFGRGGAGAVFGEKNLKAIAVTGDKRFEVKDRESVSNLAYEIMRVLITHPLTSKFLPELGTAGAMRVINHFEALGTRNFQQRSFPEAWKISGEELRRRFFKSKSGCFNCPILCGRTCELDGRRVTGPEFETLWALGANLAISDLRFIIEINEKANLLGLDTISLGGVLAFAMELKKRGVADFGVSFGETKEIPKLIEDIALRREKGEILSLGVREASKIVGGEELAMHVKGLELPAYDPRGSLGMGLGYATSNRGACHLRGGFSVSFEIYGVPKRIDRLASFGKGAHVAKAQDLGAIADSLIVCRFALLSTSLHHWARALNALTGLDYTASDLLKIGERIFNLERMINKKFGFSSKHDTLPERIKREIPLDEMLKEYYEYRGWGEDGLPKEDKLSELFEGDELQWL